MSDENVVGRVHDEGARLHLAADAQEREEAHPRFDNDLLIVLHVKKIPYEILQYIHILNLELASQSVTVTTDGATDTLTLRHWSRATWFII